MTTEDFKRKLTAILSADVVGYSRLMGEDEEATVLTLNKYKEIIFSLIEKNNGRVIDSPGDNVLAEFGSVVDAVRCGVQIQEDLKGHNDELLQDRKMMFRIGIHTGDVIQDGERIYGDGVNVAARIESLADTGGICVSRTAYDQVKDKININYDYLGEYEVKNIKEPVRVYKVLMGSKPDHKIVKGKKIIEDISRIRDIAIALAIIIAVLLTWRFYPTQRIDTESYSAETEQVASISEVKESPKTIAVIPFVNISSDSEQENFVDGLSEQIINDLTKISNLSVTSRTSSFVFKDSDKTAKEIAQILEREYILEGSVRKAGNALIITTQLIRAADDSHIWSETYDREMEDIFEIQKDIAKNVADKLKLTLEAFRILGGTENVEAYELYLEALGKLQEGIVYSTNRSALILINEALEKDSEFALAWAYKAYIHNMLILTGPSSSSKEEEDACIRAAQKSIGLEPNLANAYVYLGWIKMSKNKWLEAELNDSKALKLLDESLSGDHVDIVPFYFSVGKFKRAYELLEKMRLNDPMNQGFRPWYYITYSLLGDRQRAEEEYKNRDKSMLKANSDWHDDFITLTRLSSGDKLSHDEIVSPLPVHIPGKKHLDFPEDGLAELRQAYSTDNNLSSRDFSRIAIWAAYFGDPELALDVLKKGTGISGGTIWVSWLPVMYEVRHLPRFKEYIREIGLVDYWKEYGWPDLCRPVGDDDFECD